jgi:hypothetical protein
MSIQGLHTNLDKLQIKWSYQLPHEISLIDLLCDFFVVCEASAPHPFVVLIFFLCNGFHPFVSKK